MNMRETLARAICSTSYTFETETTLALSYRTADAVLSALETPTVGMIDAGLWEEGDAVNDPSNRAIQTRVWRAMVKAIKEGK